MADALTGVTEPVADDELLWRWLRKEWIREENGVQVITSSPLRTGLQATATGYPSSGAGSFPTRRCGSSSAPPSSRWPRFMLPFPAALEGTWSPDTEGQHASHALIVPPAGKGTNTRDRGSGMQPADLFLVATASEVSDELTLEKPV